jgi:hypothetical protein
MLRTDERLLLTEALVPPPGCELDLLVGTTYSLHLSALLAIPLGLTFADWEREDGAPTADPVAALEAVRRHAERITIFCQAGATAATGQPPLVASWLEDVVVAVKAPFDGVFHPKVWVARYRSPGAPARYRVICASRNLSFDRCWDTAVVVEGVPAPRAGLVPDSDPLADFVAALPALATASVTPERAAAIAQLAGELRRVRFAPPEGFSRVTFWPMGIGGHRSDPLAKVRRSRLLVVAPFVGSERLQSLDGERSGILVSRAEELATVPASALVHFEEVYALDEPELDAEATPEDGVLRGLHAKLYVADDGWDAHVWTGSANATSAAFGRNVEVLVRLDGKRSLCGVDAVLGAPGDDDALRALLAEVEPTPTAEEPDLATRLERELDELAHRLAERRFVAMVGGEPSRLTVELRAEPAVELPPGLTASCWPLTGLDDRDARPLATGVAVVARFAEQALADITAFYIISLSLERDGIEVHKAILIRADLEGVPNGRREAILRELLKDPEQILRLLRALLDFDPTEGPGDGVGLLADLSAGMTGRPPGETPLLESLLRALDEAPEKLDAIASLLDDLRDVDDLLPPMLLEIWEPIAAVRRERRR